MLSLRKTDEVSKREADILPYVAIPIFFWDDRINFEFRISNSEFKIISNFEFKIISNSKKSFIFEILI